VNMEEKSKINWTSSRWFPNKKNWNQEEGTMTMTFLTLENDVLPVE
jgi:hypothetical protein